MAAKATNTALKRTRTRTDSAKAVSASRTRKKKSVSGAENKNKAGRMETMKNRRSAGDSNSKNSNNKNMSRNMTENPEQIKEGIPMGNEITLVVSGGLTILMLLSNFGVCGWIGRILSSLFFGVFGFSQYFMPVIFFITVVMLIANNYSALSVKKSASLFAIMMILSGYSQLIAAPEGYMADELFGDSAANHFLGGVIAGGITEFLRSGFGLAGAVIILTCLMVLAVVTLTQKSAIAFFKDLRGNLLAAKSKYKKKAEIRKKKRKEVSEAYEYTPGTVPEEEEDWTFPDETDTAEEFEQERSRRNTSRPPALNRNGRETGMQGLKELHPEVVGLDENDGKTDPFTGELDYSAFDTGNRQGSPEISDDLMRALKGEMAAEPSGAPKTVSKMGSSLEEIRIHHGEEDDMPVSEDREIFEDAGAEEFHDIDGEFLDIDEEFSPINTTVPETGQAAGPLEAEEIFEPAPIAESEEEVQDPDDAFRIVEDAPEENEIDPKQAMKMSRTPVTSKEKRGGLPDIYEDEGEEEKGLNRKDSNKSRAQKPVKEQEPVVHRAGDPKPVGDKKPVRKADYIFPPITLLTKDDSKRETDRDADLKETAMKLQQTLESFGVNVKITDISCGPSVTRYELFPEQGVKVSKIVSLTDDIKLNLAATDVRIEAPIPGKAAIGIEVPNKKVQTVHFRDLIDNRTFKNMKSRLSFAAGKDIGGKIVMADLAKMPHMLVAGTTGSGKSVFINTIIMSILYKASPEEVRFIMVDPKMVELSVYNGIPHLLIPVVTDPKKASNALSWAVAEMTDRYRKFAETGTRNLSGYNKKVQDLIKAGEIAEGKLEKLPQIVIVIDELADLMMVAKSEVEDAVVRLSQLARAAGIHMIIATQRPSVDVITGLIKANVPSRVALSVSSGTDSRTIIDMNGAEKLLGNGDMLFYPSGYQKPVRVQGAFISDEDIIKVTDFIRENEQTAAYDPSVTEKIEKTMKSVTVNQDRDEYFEAAARFIIEKDKATIGMLQRMFKIGFNRAARIIDQLAEAGIVGPEEGTKPRKILMSPEELDQFFEENA